MTKIINLFRFFNLSSLNSIYQGLIPSSFKSIFFTAVKGFNPFIYLSFYKFKFMILSFIFIYTIFLIIMTYILYKSYLLSLSNLNEFIYNNMSIDISKLNWNFPIHSYVETIPSIEHINQVYRRLDILDYTDYIYGMSPNTQVLHSILSKSPELQSKTSSVVLADIIYQNSQLFADLGEELVRRVVKLSFPLVVAIALFGVTLLVEPSEIVSILS